MCLLKLFRVKNIWIKQVFGQLDVFYINYIICGQKLQELIYLLFEKDPSKGLDIDITVNEIKNIKKIMWKTN